jgi:hypothetical protein
LEHGAGASGRSGAEAKPSTGLIDVGSNELQEVADDISPLVPAPSGGETVDGFLVQQSSTERAEHMASNRSNTLVKYLSRIDNGFPCPENILHNPSLAIAKRDNKRRELCIGADDIDTIESGSGGHPLGVDGEVAIPSLALGPEKAAEAFVADPRFVASAQGPFQSRKGRLAGCGLVVTDDVAAMPAYCPDPP